MHFFDVSKCARASTLWNGCPTPQVCVERCPTEYYYPYSETAFSAVIDKQHKKHMQPFCSSEMTDAMVEDESTTMKWLIENNICPPWLVTSAPFLKRCLPSIVSDPADDSNTDIKNDTVIVEADKNPNEDADITAGEMLKSMENVARFLNVRSLGEKVFADLASSWWLILIGLVVGTILSFVWIILMRSSHGAIVLYSESYGTFHPFQIRGRGNDLVIARAVDRPRHHRLHLLLYEVLDSEAGAGRRPGLLYGSW